MRYRADGKPFVAAFAQNQPQGHAAPADLKPGSGPAEDEFENTRIIGQRQSDKARELANHANQVLSGEVDYRMRFVDMSRVQVGSAYTPTARFTPPAQPRWAPASQPAAPKTAPAPALCAKGTANPS